MTVLKSADGRYFDIPEDIIAKYLVEDISLPGNIDNPEDWQDKQGGDVSGQSDGKSKARPVPPRTASLGVRG